MLRLLPALILLTSGLHAEDKTVDFNRDIRPILSNKCFQCHGPDKASLKADLRLDLPESAHREKAIVPGKADLSEMISRVLASDPDDIMPPPKVKKPVTPAEADLLRRWINEGAAYAGHWAFEPVRATGAPPVKRKDWAKNEVDRFILAALEKDGITPSPEADPRTLIRRLSLDLTGLTSFFPITKAILTKPSPLSPVSSSPHRTTASDGDGTGSIRLATGTRTATPSTVIAKCGPTATG